MQGVTILSENTTSSFINSGFATIIIMALMVIFTLIAIFKTLEKEYFHLIWAIPTILFLLYCLRVSCKGVSSPTYTTTYKVIVDDTVNFNEFNSKYKVISQDGKILTVELRSEE